jgi:hypothetical protein
MDASVIPAGRLLRRRARPAALQWLLQLQRCMLRL